MNNALAPALDHFAIDPVARHLSGLLEDVLREKVGVLGGPQAKMIRLLAASPGSPVVGALKDHLRDLAIRDFEFRFVFAESGPVTPADDLVAALERARVGLSGREGVLRLIGGPAARKVNESMVVGERLAWIGAPVPDKREVLTDFGQLIRRPSAVHLAAMGFESVRVGSMPWISDFQGTAATKPARLTMQSMLEWRPGATR